MSNVMWHELFIAFWQTLYMVFLSGVLAAFIGLPLGVILQSSRVHHILENKWLNFYLGTLINAGRSIPFIILLIAIIPFTRFVVGTSIGTTASIVPLTVAAIPFFARIVENTLLEVSPSLTEAALSMGANPWQIITRVLIPEALPGIINGFTVLLINLIGYSAMAGAVGGGGLGDLAVRYGYQRFDVKVMVITIIVLILLVQVIQYLGDKLVKLISYYK